VPAARSFPEGTSIRNSTYDPRTSAAGASRSPFTGRAFPRVPGTAVPLGPHFEDHARRSRSAFDPELFENVLEMFSDRPRTRLEDVADLGVGFSFRDPRQDLSLATSQPRIRICQL